MPRTLAIVERLTGHTEDMGGFASLALELGYDTHLFYERSDPYHLLDYYQTRLPIAADRIHDWSEVMCIGRHFEIILLNTSFVWLDYMGWVHEVNANHHLIVVHHHPDDVELNPCGSSVYLTPAQGEEKWIFPIYSKPVAPEGPGTGEIALASEDASELPTLTCLGTFEGKDIGGAIRYLEAGGKLRHYDRRPCRYFSGYDGAYAQHLGLNGVEYMASLAQQEQPIHLWMPILPERDYLVCRLTAALITGVEMTCIMIMPEALRKLYGFPEQSVITYTNSVTEAECLNKLRESARKQFERQRQLRRWAASRWEKNLEVFRSLMEPRIE